MDPIILQYAALIGIVTAFISGYFIGRWTSKPKPCTHPWWYDKLKSLAEDADKVTVDFVREKFYTTTTYKD